MHRTYSIHMMCRWWWATCWTPSSTFAYNTIAIVIVARRRWWRCCGAEQSKHLFRWDWPFFVNIAAVTSKQINLKWNSLNNNNKVKFFLINLQIKRRDNCDDFIILTHILMTIHLPMMSWCQYHLDLASVCLYSVCEMMRNPNTLLDLGANRLSVWNKNKGRKQTSQMSKWCMCMQNIWCKLTDFVAGNSVASVDVQ